MRADLPPRRSGSRGLGPWLTLLLVTVLLLGASPATALVGDEDDLGARSLKGETWSTPQLEPDDQTREAPVLPMTPPLSDLYSLEPSYYGDGCHAGRTRTSVLPGCVYGDPSGGTEVAMVGDSKIGRLFPAIEEVALREGWALRTYTKSACAFVDAPTPGYDACDDYNEALATHLAADPPDIVLTGAMRRDAADDYARTWEWLRGIGVQDVVGLWDSPVPTGGSPAACVADALEAGADLTSCAVLLPEESSGNPSMRTAAQRVDGASFIDLRDWVCPESALSPTCAPVLGRVQLYGSGSHLSPLYGQTLTDPIHQRLHEIGVAAYRPSVDRVSGRDRYATAANLSREVEPGGRVFVASGRDYPDALAAAARAGADRGAVLLTGPGSLPAATREALDRLDPAEVVVVGGEARITGDVLDQLEGYAPRVSRVSGEDRYGTAAEISRLQPMMRGGTVYVATGAGFADALAAAAQAGQEESPILLVRTDSVPGATADALHDLAPRRVVVVGGTASVSEEVLGALQDLAGEVERRGGENRYETAALLAQGTEPGRVLHVSVGTDYADALAAAPVAAASRGAVLLVAPDRVPSWTGRAVGDLRPERLVLTGGRAAISLQTQRELIRLVPTGDTASASLSGRTSR